MAGFEASNTIQPHRNARHYKLTRRRPKGYIGAIVMMFMLVGLLCANNYYLLHSYYDLKNELTVAFKEINTARVEKQKLVTADTILQNQYQQLTEEYNQLKEHYSKTSRGSDDLSKQLDTLKKQNSTLSKQNSTLSKQNKDLVNDNIALQNSLKMAASVGIKPQSFSVFEGLLPRENISRGKYIGKFLGTAYTPSKEECGNDKGITKSGNPVMPGVSIAIDNHYWPFGTVFYIKGLGYTVAMDTGSAIKGRYRFDFSVFDKSFAKQLGSRKWEVYLVKLGTGSVKNVKL